MGKQTQDEMLLCSHELLVVQSPQSRRLRQPAIGEQLAFMSTRPEHSQGEEGMLNLLLGITVADAGADADRARQLPGQRSPDLRQLPHSAWSGGSFCHG